MPFGDVVRARRTALMISLNDMAERLGISPGYWSRVERGIEGPPSDELVKCVAAILGIPTRWNGWVFFGLRKASA
jgi:transcriptional regulator with XRE-family HTH domain